MMAAETYPPSAEVLNIISERTQVNSPPVVWRSIPYSDAALKRIRPLRIIWWWENYYPTSKILKLKIIVYNKSRWNVSRGDWMLGRLRIRYWFLSKRKPHLMRKTAAIEWKEKVVEDFKKCRQHSNR